MKNCPFCQIAAGQIPAQIIYQDRVIMAFLDNHPKSLGHVLIIPKEHFNSLFSIPTNLLTAIITQTQKISRKINDVLQPEGLNILQNNGQIAGQSIDHFHLHIIPRYQNNNLRIKKDNLPMVADKLKI